MKKTITILLLSISLGISAQCWQQVSAGGFHTVGVKADGTLWSWGYNEMGELGNGAPSTTPNNNVPVQVGTDTHWLKVDAGWEYTLAIKTDGTLWAWGVNTDGELGNGTLANSSVPVQIGTATDWQSISAGTGASAAIKTNGTLWTWGAYVGNGSANISMVPLQLGTDTWTSICRGDGSTLAIKSNGSLWGWGQNGYGQLGNGSTTDLLTATQIGTATWLTVATYTSHSIGIKTNNSLFCWGHNDYGQVMGTGSNVQDTPTEVYGANVPTSWKSVSVGHQHTLAVSTDGQLYTSGYGGQGQIGVGTSNSNGITHIGTDTDWEFVSAGHEFSLGVKTDGSLKTWGTDNYGQLGAGGGFFYRTSPTAVACPTSTLGITPSEVLETINLYPNPVKDMLNVSFYNVITAVSIYNLLGQEVLAKTINANAGSIDFSNLGSGTYFVKVSADNAVKTIKIIKE